MMDAELLTIVYERGRSDGKKQRRWVGLTPKEWSIITDEVIGFNSCCGWEEDYAKAIEAKLKEKNYGS